jgi:hypothetical protein
MTRFNRQFCFKKLSSSNVLIEDPVSFMINFLKRRWFPAFAGMTFLCSVVWAQENLAVASRDVVISAPPAKQETIAAPEPKQEVIHTPEGLTIQDLTGEVISYSIKEGILRIGSAKMAFEGLVKNGDEESVLIHITWGIPGFNSDERIYVDPETFYPKFVYKERMKFGCKIRVVEDYFPDEGKVSIYRDTCGNVEQHLADRGAPVESIYARIYRLRMMGGSLDEIQPFVVRMPEKDENFKLEGIKKLNYARQEHEARHFASETFGIWMADL